MKTIGLIDYYISEWHANNYPKWIAAANEALGTDYKVGYVYAELDVSPRDGVTTAEWCEKFGAVACKTIGELCEKSDVVMILAPSDPEKHLAYAKEAFPYGKRTYVDKTFAPSLEIAMEIFALGKQYGTPFFSTSALRYAEELDALAGAEHLLVTGGGSNLPEYIVHQLEMVVKVQGMSSATATASKQGAHRAISLVGETPTGERKNATLLYAPSLPFTLCAEDAAGKSVYKAVKSEFFPALLRDVIRFYETGEMPFDPNETLSVMALRDAVLKVAE